MFQHNGERFTFSEFSRRWPDWPAPARAIAFDTLSERQQAECWADLAERSRIRLDDEHAYERVALGYEEPPPAKRHQPAQRSTWATSTRPGDVTLSSDDPLKQMEPPLYVEALTGIEVPPGGTIRCPLHDERTPSFKAYLSAEQGWYCFGCHAGGGVIDLAAALYGIDPRGRDYWRLRDLILERLLGAPLHPKGNR
jgi:CHC2 zinc finger